jgi:SAM-dependent methyltransferase
VVRPPAAVGTSFQIGNLRRIRRLVDRLESRFVHDGEWEAYAVDCHYDPAADGAKREAVRELLRLAQPASVLDLGCNSGNYSYLAAETGARVVAADGDEGAIARLYARLKAKPADINPVVINLGNPSPALGWGNVERSDFLGRGRSACVLALALIHHLRVAGNWPISHIVKFLSRLAVGHLLAEFVPREDPMFRSITRLRDEDYADWTVGAWHAELNREFELVREVALPASARTLSLWRRR